MSGPLAGTRVLEIANFISGPYAAVLLADMGADVLKLEMPGTGDPFRDGSSEPGAPRPQFASYNRGKRSITVNLRSPDGVAVVKRLTADVDVLIENFRPGTMEKMGLGYDMLRAINPSLVYCSVTGFGSTGPQSHKPTYDAIAQAVSGLWSSISDIEEPRPVGPAMSDQLSGMYAAQSVLGALVGRGSTGEGQRVEVSMMGASMAFLTNSVAAYLMTGEIGGPDTRPKNSQSYGFLGGDGRPFAVHLSSVPKFWEGLAKAAGREELLEDPRSRTKPDRVANYDFVHDQLQEAFATKTRDEWLVTLEEYDVPAAAINNVAEAVEDPQARHLGMARTFGKGQRAVDLVGFPAIFRGTPAEPELPPPDLGEHTNEALLAIGYDEAEIDRLRAEQVI